MMSKELIEEMFRKHYMALKIYATSVLNNKDLADDMVQEVFRIVCKKDLEMDLSSIKGQRAFLKSILRKVIANYWKTLHRRIKHEVEMEVAPELGLTPDMEAVSLRAEYGDMIDEEDMELIIYMVTNKVTYQEAADKFGIVSAEACRKRVKRIFSKLREKLE